MNKHKVFIDGQSGTTGLEIYHRIQHHLDCIEILEIPENQKKNVKIKSEYLNEADLVILCLPDIAAKESVAMIDKPNVKILDASTAHRVDTNWIYGLPELFIDQKEKIKNNKYVSNPGCYPTGFLLAIVPLIQQQILPPDVSISVHAISGYSGGGRKMIEAYEQGSLELKKKQWQYRPYGLTLQHKHLPEMKKYSGLNSSPLFSPAVGNFRQGMLIQIPIFLNTLKKQSTLQTLSKTLQSYYYNSPLVSVLETNPEKTLEDGFLCPTTCNQTDRVEIMLFGNKNQVLLVARLDNLGKGASGAAIQNMNLMLGIEEYKGLKY